MKDSVGMIVTAILFAMIVWSVSFMAAHTHNDVGEACWVDTCRER